MGTGSANRNRPVFAQRNDLASAHTAEIFDYQWDGQS